MNKTIYWSFFLASVKYQEIRHQAHLVINGLTAQIAQNKMLTTQIPWPNSKESHYIQSTEIPSAVTGTGFCILLRWTLMQYHCIAIRQLLYLIDFYFLPVLATKMALYQIFLIRTSTDKTYIFLPLFLCCYSVMKSCPTLQCHGLQYVRLPCPSPSPGVWSDLSPLSWWCYPTISSSVIPFSSCLQSFPASRSFSMSQFFTSGGQSSQPSDAYAFQYTMFVTAFLPRIKRLLISYF